ncbi:hypothetical protein AB0I77_03405 [Streptomyces sp. NPDC050619]|uniref:hypothetical protein n=1 Tax=Streptomyces sp. NPDC050619 TaxID=3157214 RepID=UPI0034414B66
MIPRYAKVADRGHGERAYVHPEAALTGALNSVLYAEQYPTRYRYTGASVATSE